LRTERPLGGYFRAISNALTQDLQQQTERLGLTSSQGMFLHHLWKRQTQEGLQTCARDLEEFFYIKHSTVSGILQRMEAGGFLTIQANDCDKRRKTIALTQKALDAHAEIEGHLRQSEQLLMKDMTEQEQLEFRRLIQMAAKNLGVCCRRPTIEEKEESL